MSTVFIRRLFAVEMRNYISGGACMFSINNEIDGADWLLGVVARMAGKPQTSAAHQTMKLFSSYPPFMALNGL